MSRHQEGHETKSSAEGQPLPAPRKPAGGAGRISPQERREIQEAYLTTPGATVSSLARDYGRTRETIGTVVKSEDCDLLRAELWEHVRAEATQGLRAHVLPAVQAWGKAVGIAATGGNHKPAKELLEATGVVDRETSHQTNVQIVIGMPGHPAGPDPFIGIAVTELASKPST